MYINFVINIKLSLTSDKKDTYFSYGIFNILCIVLFNPVYVIYISYIVFRYKIKY